MPYGITGIMLIYMLIDIHLLILKDYEIIIIILTVSLNATQIYILNHERS